MHASPDHLIHTSGSGRGKGHCLKVTVRPSPDVLVETDRHLLLPPSLHL